jgi:hypothetical protein
MTSTDLFLRRANECRRLAAAARDAADKAFWLELVERWQAARQRCLRQVLMGDLKQKHSPGRGGKAAEAKSSPAERGGHSQRLAG